MRLELENVGKIESANIKLDGITVIAGENNTGKSTVGKMLFCVFHSFYKIEEQVKAERTKTISRVVMNYYHETSNRITQRLDPMELANYIVERKEDFFSDTRILVKELEAFYLRSDSGFDVILNQESLEQLAEKIYRFLKIEDDEIRKVILKKRLDAEFAMKTGYLNSLDKKTKVNLTIKNNNIAFEIVQNQEIILNHYMSLVKDIIYIDDPFVLDNLNIRVPFKFMNQYEHRTDLLTKITSREDNSEFSALDELMVKQRFDRIFEAMNDVCDGELFTNDGGTYVYKTGKLNGNLEMVNLSTGMKSFVILRKLLQNGSIDENGIVILDEPEIHLHPEWQLKFAEVIVLIQREFGTNILLNTHSPYFLNAIEVYSQKYGISGLCNYYLTDEINGKIDIVDVTGKIERIYEKLAKPLQELENMEYR